jgi:APA family basic amino acid/polyamine antiporter
VVELGAALPSAGGWYVYSRRAFGDAVGFSVGWSDWLAQSASLAYLAVSIGDFAAVLWPRVASDAKLTALLTLAAFTAIQWLGLRSSSWTQEATSLLKGLALLILVALCFLHPAEPAAVGVAVASLRPGLGLAAVMLALQSIIATYDGWYTAIYFTEEDRDPERNLPRGALGGVLCTIGLYLLFNLALLHLLGVKALSEASLPAAAAAQAIFGGSGGAIVTALALASLLSVINAVLMLATRILFAVARDGLFAQRATNVNDGGTPVFAMLLTTAAACGLVLSGTFEQLLAVASVLLVGVYASGFLALLTLRRREPELRRPFRVPGYPWTPLLMLAVSAAFLVANVAGDPRSSALALGLLAASYPAYRLLARGRDRRAG